MIVQLPAQYSLGCRLVNYLKARWARTDLKYRESVLPFSDGWETYVYRFQLRDAGDLPEGFDGPLILRMYASPRGVDRLRHEFAVQEHMLSLGYPVAKPLLLEEDDEPLGGPFMIMVRTPGRTLLQQLQDCPSTWRETPYQFGYLHARLHQLPVRGFPASPEPYIDRQLAHIGLSIGRYRLSGLAAGLAWLRTHRPEPSESPRILHGDFHLLNLMVEGPDCRAVLDWSEADVGDRHADVAATLVLLRSAPVRVPITWQWCISPLIRHHLRKHYLLAYRESLPLEPDRLGYFLAWAALRRLCQYGVWLRAGLDATGWKPAVVNYLSRGHVGVLCKVFREQARLRVSL
jgi:aminoglycoside phosphotransferase (APT) family kinase protein